MDRLSSTSSEFEDELDRIETEIKKTEWAIDRYLAAFEDGSMAPSQCGPRLEQLSGRLRQLKTRRVEINDLEAEQPEVPDKERSTMLHGQLAAALRDGETATVKALLKELIASIDVYEGLVQPSFRLPGAVRTRSRSAPPTGFEPVLPP